MGDLPGQPPEEPEPDEGEPDEGEPDKPDPGRERPDPFNPTRLRGEFELFKDATNKFRFRLVAGNGETIMVSGAYDSKASALNGIDSVRMNAPEAELVDQTTT